MAGIDLFNALGVDKPPPPDGPNVRVAPSPQPDQGGIDLFKSLGVDRAQSFGPTDQMPAGAKPDARMPQPNTVARTPDLPAWAGGGVQPTREPVSVAPQKETLGNVAAGIPSGLYEGVARIPNIPTDIVNAASGAIRGVTGHDYGHLQPPINTNPTGYQPQGKWAQGARDAASAASNTAALGGIAGAVAPMFPAGTVLGNLSRGLQPSAGTVAASAVGGAAEEPVARNVPERYRPLARFGANLGAGLTTAGVESALGGATRSAITPETAQLAQLGRDTYGIPITAAQMSDNRIIKTADSVLKSVPFSGHGDLDHEVQLAVNQATLRQIGENATKGTPDVIQRARQRIGGELQDVENNNVLNLGPDHLQRLADIQQSATGLQDSEQHVIDNLVNGIHKQVQNGQIQGATYGDLMRHQSPLDTAAASGGNIGRLAGQIKQTLRDSLQQSLSGDDLSRYQQARTQWKNLVSIIEPVLQRADVVGGASASTGDINPVALRALVNKSYPDAVRRAPGEIPLNDIADIGQRFLKETPSSHTSERGWMIHLLTGMGGAALEGGGVPWHTMAAGAAGLGTGAITGRIASGTLQSDALANRMIRQGLQGAQPGVGQATAQAAVPLMTSAGVRQLEPPEQPSTNPGTGLPQFSFEANQADHRRHLADAIVSGFKDGSLASPAALKGYVDQNKRELRGAFGGQGLHNILLVHAMMRRPSNLFSVISSAPSSAVQGAMNDAGITDAHGLASLAILSPELAKILATGTSKQNLTKAGEAQVVAGIKQAIGGSNDADIRTRNRVDGGLRGSGAMGQNRAGNQPGVPPNVAANAGASL